MHGGEVAFGGGVGESFHEFKEGASILVLGRLGAHGVVVGDRVMGRGFHGTGDAIHSRVEGGRREARTDGPDLGHAEGPMGLNPLVELGRGLHVQSDQKR